MSLCKSIDTLSMAYLDDELAAEERHELEAHLTECSQCRSHVDQERADRSIVRKALAVGPAPDLLRARIGKALDAEDRAEQKAQRRRWYQYMLPGSAMVAAAAAIALFVGVQNDTAPTGRSKAPLAASARPLTGGKVTSSVTNVTRRSLPLEVQGASTGPWLRENFAPQIEPPKFANTDNDVIGARLLPGGIDGHDAALVAYNVTLHGKPFVLTVLFVRDIGPSEWNEGDSVKVNNRMMHVLRAEDGNQMVSYVDNRGIGYIFNAPEISTEDLVSLVGRTELVGDQ
ncbi:MAG TPA: zf-HC2 domain-containing protein [Kofleriaceae bacterium]|nr:zf-HC2 domain-containing protein [Kofleriaceae bacterium]